MLINLSTECTEEAGSILQVIYSLKRYFINNLFIKQKDYGKGVQSFWLVFNSYSPEFLIPPSEWPTGTVIYKKLNKSQKSLQLDIKLNHAEVMTAKNEQSVIEIVKRGFLASLSEVEKMSVKDFDYKRFYYDMGKFIDDFNVNAEQNNYHSDDSNQEESLELDYTPLEEYQFWKLIDEAKRKSENNYSRMVEEIISVLSTYTNKYIVEFELTLRTLIVNAFNYNVMALAKVVEGFVSDDSMLYFSAKLILSGPNIYHQVLENPNLLPQKIDFDFNGEEFLDVANSAYILKNGENEDNELPSEIADEMINYDDYNGQLSGKRWKKNEFESKFKHLIHLYS